MKIPVLFKLLYSILAVVEVTVLLSSTLPTVLTIVLIIGIVGLNTAIFITGRWKYAIIVCIFYFIIVVFLFAFKPATDTTITDGTTGETYSYSQELFD